MVQQEPLPASEEQQIELIVVKCSGSKKLKGHFLTA